MEWSEEIHKRFISKQTSTGNEAIGDETIRNLNGTLTQLRNDIETKTSSKENSKSGASKLSKAQR
eukprot:5652892-Ditylum_brightwellii.AAC.1